jgi:hypothetical protein
MAEKIVFPDFPPARCADKRDGVEFPAARGDRRFLCFAALELLWERFGARGPSEAEVLRTYEMHRPQVQAIARAQILAGKVSPENEVVLTTESFSFKEVTFSKSVRESPHYFRLAREATGVLEGIVENSAGLVSVEWDRIEDAHDRPLYRLRIRDFMGEASASFAPEQLESPSYMERRLNRLWGDLLQDRNHKQLQELLGAGQPEG